MLDESRLGFRLPALAPIEITDPEHALCMLEESRWIARCRSVGTRRDLPGFGKQRFRFGEIAAARFDLAEDMQGARASAEVIRGTILPAGRTEVIKRAFAGEFEQIETIQRLQLVAQVAKHELDQRLRLLPLALGTLLCKLCLMTAHQRCHGDRRQDADCQ